MHVLLIVSLTRTIILVIMHVLDQNLGGRAPWRLGGDGELRRPPSFLLCPRPLGVAPQLCSLCRQAELEAAPGGAAAPRVELGCSPLAARRADLGADPGDAVDGDPLAERERERGERRERRGWQVGPTATWRPTQQNHPAKQLDGQTWTVLRVGWLRMSGFRVALPNPDAVDSWMVKNGLYSFSNYDGPSMYWILFCFGPT